MNNEYIDIINLPHHVSKVHKQMSIENRAAQFAPFAALAGYEDAVKETARIIDERKELDEGLKLLLSEKLNIIKSEIQFRQQVSFTYFVPDEKKNGGYYKTITGIVKKINEVDKKVILETNESIDIDEIIDIKGECIMF